MAAWENQSVASCSKSPGKVHTMRTFVAVSRLRSLHPAKLDMRLMLFLIFFRCRSSVVSVRINNISWTPLRGSAGVAYKGT